MSKEQEIIKVAPTVVEMLLQEVYEKKDKFFPIAIVNNFKGEEYDKEFKEFCKNEEEYFKQRWRNTNN